jgi:hypothetical protein
VAGGGVTFLFDNDLSPALAEALAVLGEKAYHVRNVLGPRTPDDVWLQHAGEREWLIVTQDHRILKRPHERAALTGYRVGAFFLAKNITGHCDIARAIVKHWPEIKRAASTTPRPFLMSINPSAVRPLR